MNCDEINFCEEEDGFEVNSIKNIFQELFEDDISENEISDFYDILRTAQIENFDSCRFFGRSLRLRPEFGIRHIWGFDVPITISKKSLNNNTEKKKILILSQDPLRTDSNDHFGTPFAYHLYDPKNDLSKTMTVYYDLFKELMNQGSILYLTDLYKLYFHKQSHICFNEEPYYREKFIRFVNQEIASFKPSLIVTMGAFTINSFLGRTYQLSNCGTKAKEVDELEKYKFGDRTVPVLPIIHLSANVREDDKRGFYNETIKLNHFSNFKPLTTGSVSKEQMQTLIIKLIDDILN